MYKCHILCEAKSWLPTGWDPLGLRGTPMTQPWHHPGNNNRYSPPHPAAALQHELLQEVLTEYIWILRKISWQVIFTCRQKTRADHFSLNDINSQLFPPLPTRISLPLNHWQREIATPSPLELEETPDTLYGLKKVKRFWSGQRQLMLMCYCHICHCTGLTVLWNQRTAESCCCCWRYLNYCTSCLFLCAQLVILIALAA